MKATNEFQKTIETYLQGKAVQDFYFKSRLDLKTKSMDDCIQYILHKVKKSGANGFADQEIYDMAEYYYENDKVDIGKKVNATVVVNHKVAKENKPTSKPMEVVPVQEDKKRNDALEPIRKAMTEQKFGIVMVSLKKVKEKYGEHEDFKKIEDELKKATGFSASTNLFG